VRGCRRAVPWSATDRSMLAMRSVKGSVHLFPGPQRVLGSSMRERLGATARSAWEAARRRPLTTAVVFATAKGISADALAQLVFEGRRLDDRVSPAADSRGAAASCSRDVDQQGGESKAYDFRRTLAFATFSGLYCGGFFYWQFSVLFPYIWPVGALPGRRPPISTVLGQVALDNGFFSPCLYCPVFYVIKGAICHEQGPKESLSCYKSEFHEVISTLLTIWVPAGLVNFTLMPVWFRAPFNAMVSFGYLIVLSVQAQRLHDREFFPAPDSVPATATEVLSGSASAAAVPC